MDKIKSFTDLMVWKEGHQLVMDIYKVVKDFPTEEKFGLISQLCRAVISITSNIAEGFARQTYKDKLRFYYIALGSLVEVQNQLLIARDIGYLDERNFKEIADRTVVIQKMLNAFISKTKSFI